MKTDLQTARELLKRARDLIHDDYAPSPTADDIDAFLSDQKIDESVMGNPIAENNSESHAEKCRRVASAIYFDIMSLSEAEQLIMREFPSTDLTCPDELKIK